jgi:hypothetical protein
MQWKHTKFQNFSQFIILLFYLLVAGFTCKNFYKKENKIQVSKIQGSIYTSKYKIPIESEIIVKFNNSIIDTTYSNKNGSFNIMLNKNLIGKNLLAMITPIKDRPYIDTTINEIYKIVAECRFHHSPDYNFKTDTFEFIITDINKSLNFNLKSCYANIYYNLEEH